MWDAEEGRRAGAAKSTTSGGSGRTSSSSFCYEVPCSHSRPFIFTWSMLPQAQLARQAQRVRQAHSTALTSHLRRDVHRGVLHCSVLCCVASGCPVLRPVVMCCAADSNVRKFLQRPDVLRSLGPVHRATRCLAAHHVAPQCSSVQLRATAAVRCRIVRVSLLLAGHASIVRPWFGPAPPSQRGARGCNVSHCVAP